MVFLYHISHREIPHIRNDPQIQNFLPSNCKVGAEISLEGFDQLLNELDVFKQQISKTNSFDLRAGDYKHYKRALLYSNWHSWQEFITAYTIESFDLQKDIRYCRWLDSEDKKDFSKKIIEQNFLEAVLCTNTSTSGCFPSDILPWLSMTPPAPQFVRL